MHHGPSVYLQNSPVPYLSIFKTALYQYTLFSIYLLSGHSSLSFIFIPAIYRLQLSLPTVYRPNGRVGGSCSGKQIHSHVTFRPTSHYNRTMYNDLITSLTPLAILLHPIPVWMSWSWQLSTVNLTAVLIESPLVSTPPFSPSRVQPNFRTFHSESLSEYIV